MNDDAVPAPGAVSDPPPDEPMPPLPPSWRSLARAFVHAARAARARQAVADGSGMSLTYGGLFRSAAALSRVFARTLGPQPYVGLLLPPSVPAVVANVALTLCGKVPVNLNYAAGSEQVASAVRQCGIRQVVSARRVINKLSIESGADLILLGEGPARATLWDKLWGAFAARVVPSSWLGAFLPGLRGDDLGATATVIFTTGTTGDPKGVVLTQGNVLSNIRQVEAHLAPAPDENVLGVMPYFHAMGFTVTLWAVLCLGRSAVYHHNPLDARVVGGLCRRHAVTLIFAAPTFMRFYIRRCRRDQFRTVRRVGLGGERLDPELAVAIREALGFDPLEGYGATELSPVVSFNVDRPVRGRGGVAVPGNRPGTVGRLLPGTAVKTVDPVTRADLPRGAEGLICVKGPQVMSGYLNRPEATAEVLKNGWYVTDDVGLLDDDGFLKVAGRLSRFSKIGGEMVPHERVEAAVRAAAGAGEGAVAVTALPDARRGERLLVLYTDLGGKTPAEVEQVLATGNLPRLWQPAADDYLRIDSMPTLPTGKVNLGRLRQIARELTAARSRT